MKRLPTLRRARKTNPVSTVATWLIAVAIAVVASEGFAQSAPSAPASNRSESGEAQQQIQRIYDQTRQANTLADLVEVLTRCERTRSQPMSAEQREYLYRLTAWAYNKRGEIYADQAAALVEPEDERRAIELDSLALADFQKAVQYDPKRWKALHNRGVSFAMLGKFEEATKDFKATLELNPEYANAWFNRGEIYYETGAFEQAVADYTRAIELNPGDVTALTNRGHAQFQLGDVQAAIKDYNAVLQLNPDDSDAHTNRGDAYMAVGQWAQAAEDYEQAITLNRQSGRAYQSIAWQMATCPDENFRAITDADRQTAVRAAQQAIKLAGDGADYKYFDTLAAAYANAGMYDEAAKTQGEAIKKAPSSQSSVLRKRQALYQQQQAYRQQPRTAAAPGASEVRSR